MNPIRARLANNRAIARDAVALAYSMSDSAHDARLSWQLDRFNSCWLTMQSSVPYYNRLVRKRVAPKRFESWKDFLDCMPVMNRAFVREHCRELSDTSRMAEFLRITGGSTSQPLQLPAWRSELNETDPNTWLGRSWYGITPYDSLFLLWGHSHLLGHGIRGWFNGQLRCLKDSFLGYTRWSAYDLSASAMRSAGLRLERTGADYVLGYSVALDCFARCNSGFRLSPKRPIKAIIGTAECFPNDDTPRLLESLLQAPVAMEYGSIETGAIAHTTRTGPYRVFWRSHLLECVSLGANGTCALRVTSLYPRCFPLVRYEMGDEIQDPDNLVGCSSFSKVLGRSNAYLQLEDNKRIHSAAISACVRDQISVQAYQFVHDGDRLVLRLQLDKRFGPVDGEQIIQRLGRIDRALQRTQIEVVESLERTVAGKTPLVISRKW